MSPKRTTERPGQHAGPAASAGRAESGASKPLPLWIGAAVGLVVAAVIVGLALRGRSAPPSQQQQQTQQQTQAAAATVTPPVSVARPAPPPAPVEKVVVFPVAHPAPSSSVGKTVEREAVDALHSGDLRRAAELYAALAAKYPDNPAFVEAARQLAGARGAR